MVDGEQADSGTREEKEEALFEQIEKARVAREQVTKVRGGRRLIVPFRDTIPSERLHR
jgi:hypothetical protein